MENITRKQLNLYEEAKAVRTMLERGLTEDGAAQALGWPKQRVTARVKVLELPERAQQLIGEGVIPPGRRRPTPHDRRRRPRPCWTPSSPTSTTATPQVVYIGKADVLRRRLTQFGQFGAGEPVGHRGGRLIWQLADAGDLLVAWHEITWGEAARDYERRLLAAFAEQRSGRRPFANLTG